ncbi:MAG: DNA glycosylase [Bacillota bacterium]|nr:DNA glycosylase [Bacillota bacterium]
MRIVLNNAMDFLPEHTFECGQCFRWNKEKDGSFTGVAKGRAVNLSYDGRNIIIDGADNKDETFWRAYLDLTRDYGKIKESISSTSVMREALNFGYGIRILKQEFFETLISFIISQRSSIPKIKSCIEKMCREYGKEIEYKGKIYYSFPSTEELKEAKESDFEKFGVGYRAKYLERAVKDVLEGKINEEELLSLSTKEARAKLLEMYGVGNKVADCVLLFGLSRFDSFPVDVWVDRAMKEFFNGGDGITLFGENSGFAQQYLFYYKRSIG